MLLTLLVLLYTAQKIEVLIAHKDDRIVLTELPYFYDDTETITGSDKFNVAFGLEKEIEEDLIKFQVVL